MRAEPPTDCRFDRFKTWMESAGMGAAAVEAFRYYYGELTRGETGIIPESEIEPLTSLPDSTRLEAYAAAGRKAMAETAVIKLNGGLGTGMGLEKAKSLLVVKAGLTFLDILARQILRLRESTGQPIPLVLMNSFSTHSDSLAALSRYPELSVGLPLAFVQNKTPKVLKEGLNPPDSGPDDHRNWCPPGHGDIYVALQTSGIMQSLRACGIRYLFISNSDNLGAVVDEAILGYLAAENLPFLMEAADRTETDNKGGHLARRVKDGRLILRESAQTTEEDSESFQDIRRHRYFNTNNIWVDVSALEREISGGVLKLPLIRNEKTLDPRDVDSPRVYQLETAMGSAIEVFAGAAAVRVPRSRFAPVKSTSDLLAVRSDAYELTDDFRVAQNPLNRFGVPNVALDARYYKFVDDLDARFPAGPPSLTDCAYLCVEGDILFGGGVRAVGNVVVTNPREAQARIPAGTVLAGETVL